MTFRSGKDFSDGEKKGAKIPEPQTKNQMLIEKPFELENLPVQNGSKTITRKFALIPDTYYKRQEYKKITNRMVKFRDLENKYIHILINALQNGQLTVQNFERPSKQFIKSNIYNNLSLTNVRADQFKNVELKERMKRCAVQYPFHAVRNYLIRNHNLSRIIAQLALLFRSNKDLVVSFLLGKSVPREIKQSIFNSLTQNIFGNNQNLSYFLIDNMVGQIRNIFLENASLDAVLNERLGQVSKNTRPVQDFLKECIVDFSYKKKSKFIKLKIEELVEYFLNRYFISLKSKDIRKVKNAFSKSEFKRYKQNRDEKLDQIKKYIKLKLLNFNKKEVQMLILESYDLVLKDYKNNPNIILTKHIFKPFFIKSPLTTPSLQGFLGFFKNILQNKIKEHFKELFLTKNIITTLLNDLQNIKQNIATLTKIPKIKELSVPIIAKEQIYQDDYANLKTKLSFIQREFINFTIQAKKGRIASLLGEEAIAKVPTITFKHRKLILSLPFEVKRKVVSKQSDVSSKKVDVEIGVDLGLKHFAVLSVMDTKDKEKPIEIARYFIGSKQLFDMKFDSSIGKFVNRDNHKERKPSNVKLRLIHLRENIKSIQKNKNEYENRCNECGQDFKKKLKFHKLSESLSILWERSHNINREIVRQLNHHIIAIACFHGASKIKMENLKFSRHSKKRERGNYLAFWQTHWLFGQIQEAVKLQAYLHHVNFERFGAAYTSQRCSECGLIEYKDVNGAYVYFKDGLSQKEQKKQGISRTQSRAGKQFICQNIHYHKNKKIFRLDADLNAARIIVLA
jgi:hypothetical protein